ncbi:BnaC01g22500D [Brassica napus]|uniref:BnaC01g22500D protein n=1 Tax=Brassica napus TaxID=3708 RepID=A0A078IEK4_BRANA|nr:BnaC01g22500D [Brassica napus]
MGILHKQNLSFVILLLLGFCAVSYACDCTTTTHSKTTRRQTTSSHSKTTSSHSKTTHPAHPTTSIHSIPSTLHSKTAHHQATTSIHSIPYAFSSTANSNPTKTPCPPPPPPPIPCPPPPPALTPEPETCSIDALKLGACVDVLGGLIHIGLGKSYAKATCCPVLGGLVGLDAAVCLCTTIGAKLLNIDLIIPIALELLVDCGKTPPRDFKCPAPQKKTPLLA